MFIQNKGNVMLIRLFYLWEVYIVIIEKGMLGQMVMWYQLWVDYLKFDLFISEYLIVEEVMDVKKCYEDLDKLQMYELFGRDFGYF